MKNLFLILKSEYYDQIESGTKRIEYRLFNEYWSKRLCNSNYNKVIFQKGYSKKYPQLKFEIEKIQIEKIKHNFFGNDSILVYAIYFK
jgi:ASC-1-like (ASCH) protein